jgi:hypothetical protein
MLIETLLGYSFYEIFLPDTYSSNHYWANFELGFPAIKEVSKSGNKSIFSFVSFS